MDDLVVDAFWTKPKIVGDGGVSKGLLSHFAIWVLGEDCGCELVGVLFLCIYFEVLDVCIVRVLCKYFQVLKGDGVAICIMGVVHCGCLLTLVSVNLVVVSLPKMAKCGHIFFGGKLGGVGGRGVG